MATLETYDKIEKLGSGTYSTVYKARDRRTNKIVALKDLIVGPDETIAPTSIRESVILQHLHHPNVIPLYEVLKRDKIMWLVFEFMDMDLAHYMDYQRKSSGFNDTMVKALMYQLLEGMNYVHGKGVMHRDLKPQNILVNRNGLLKIADFGLARQNGVMGSKYSCDVVTLWYRSPDVLVGNRRYSFGIDIWSAGCILGEMILGRALFPGENREHQLSLIFGLLGSPTLATWPDYWDMPNPQAFSEQSPAGLRNTIPLLDDSSADLLGMLLKMDPRRRISAKTALSHPWLKVAREHFRPMYASVARSRSRKHSLLNLRAASSSLSHRLASRQHAHPRSSKMTAWSAAKSQSGEASGSISSHPSQSNPHVVNHSVQLPLLRLGNVQLSSSASQVCCPGTSYSLPLPSSTNLAYAQQAANPGQQFGQNSPPYRNQREWIRDHVVLPPNYPNSYISRERPSANNASSRSIPIPGAQARNPYSPPAGNSPPQSTLPPGSAPYSHAYSYSSPHCPPLQRYPQPWSLQLPRFLQPYGLATSHAGLAGPYPMYITSHYGQQWPMQYPQPYPPASTSQSYYQVPISTQPPSYSAAENP